MSELAAQRKMERSEPGKGRPKTEGISEGSPPWRTSGIASSLLKRIDLMPANSLPKLTITIDGPAGAGKTTMARLLAEKLGYLYLDTGAMYRAITLKAMKEKVDFRDEEALVKMAQRAKIKLKFKPHFRVFLDHRDVSREIRTPEVTAKVHYLANLLGVRKVMWRLQRLIGKGGGIVAEGRDTGTIVFPEADMKFYLEARSSERARRRQKDFKLIKRTIGLKKLEKEIKDRDKKDLKRKIAPLKKAGDAIIIDTTNLTIEQVLERMLEHISV